MIALNKICSCGRAWLHCTSCGSGSLYCLHDASVHASQKHTGKPVDDTGLVIKIYRCKNCGESFSANDCSAANCSAPSESQKKQIKTAMRSIESQIITEAQNTTVTAIPTSYSGDRYAMNDTNSEASEAEKLPEGWSRNAEGKIDSPVSLSDIIRSTTRMETEKKKG